MQPYIYKDRNVRFGRHVFFSSYLRIIIGMPHHNLYEEINVFFGDNSIKYDTHAFTNIGCALNARVKKEPQIEEYNVSEVRNEVISFLSVNLNFDLSQK